MLYVMRLHRTGPDMHEYHTKYRYYLSTLCLSQDGHMLLDLNPEYAWTPVCLDWAFGLIGLSSLNAGPDTYVLEVR